MTAYRRVVFDTSTLVSAALRVGSVPHQALRQAISVGELVVSADTLSELDRVLQRPKFDRYQLPEVRIAFVGVLRSVATQVDVSAADLANVAPACRDPKDNPFLALVLAGKADALISSDADLLSLHPWRGVHVVTPAAYLKSHE